MTDTITLPSGAEVDVAEDPEDASLYATGLTVSASEKASTGSYSNYEPHESLKTQIRPVVRLDEGGMAYLRTRANELNNWLRVILGEAIVNHPATDRQRTFDR